MPWHQIVEFARWAPSPHNTQPCRIKIINDTTAELYFVCDRGLRVGDPQGKFTFLTFGIFVETLAIATSHHGYTLTYEYTEEPLYVNDEPLQKIATLKLSKGGNPDPLGLTLIKKRRTSRLPYDKTPITDEAINELHNESKKYKNTITFRRDKKSIRYVVELNKDSFFYDLEHESYRKELRSWLRYSHAESVDKKDGLAAETMHIPGKLIHSFMYRHRFYTAPVIKQIMQRIYTNTMKGISTIAWIQGPYKTQADWIRTGHLMMRLWLIVTKHGLYWQPYGSIITNEVARKNMINKFDITDEDEGNNMVWLLLRVGCSPEPPAAERLELKELFI